MLRFILSTTVAVLVIPRIASAEESMFVAQRLGALLAAENVCGMSYDQNAIQRFIEKNVADDDLEFAGSLPMMTKGQEMQVGEMTESGKTAFCAQQRRVAKKFGFVQ